MGLMAFEQVLRRSLAGATLGLIAAAAYFQARGISCFVATSLASDGLVGGRTSPADGRSVASLAPTEPARNPPSDAPPDDHFRSARAILDRNPFDSTTPRPLDAPPKEPNEHQDPIDLEHYENAPPCDGMKALIVVAAEDPRDSTASLTSAPSGAAKLVRAGETIGDKTVRIIEWNRVVLSTSSALCQVQMFRGSKPIATVPTSPPKPAVVRSSLPSDLAAKIQKVSSREFTIERGIVEKILDSQGDLMRATRLMPEEDEGKVRGLRLSEIKPETLLAELGFENGDSIRYINGLEIANASTALEAYSRLKTSDHLTVMLHRGDGTISLNYNVRAR